MATPRSDAALPLAVRKRLRELEDKVDVLTTAVGMLRRMSTQAGIATVEVAIPRTAQRSEDRARRRTHSRIVISILPQDQASAVFAEPAPEPLMSEVYEGFVVKGAEGTGLHLGKARAARQAMAVKLLRPGKPLVIEPVASPFVPAVAPAKAPKASPGPTQGKGGVAGALLRGEAALVSLTQAGELIPAEQLARAWGLTRQALSAAAQRGEVAVVKVRNKVYAPALFLVLAREPVSQVCRALGTMEPMEKLNFWTREHGALGGKTVVAAVESGRPLSLVVQLARAWALERGVAADPEAQPMVAQPQASSGKGARPGAEG